MTWFCIVCMVTIAFENYVKLIIQLVHAVRLRSSEVPVGFNATVFQQYFSNIPATWCSWCIAPSTKLVFTNKWHIPLLLPFSRLLRHANVSFALLRLATAWTNRVYNGPYSYPVGHTCGRKFVSWDYVIGSVYLAYAYFGWQLFV